MNTEENNIDPLDIKVHYDHIADNLIIEQNDDNKDCYLLIDNVTGTIANLSDGDSILTYNIPFEGVITHYDSAKDNLKVIFGAIVEQICITGQYQNKYMNVVVGNQHVELLLVLEKKH